MEINQKVGWELIEHLQKSAELLLVCGGIEEPVYDMARALAPATPFEAIEIRIDPTHSGVAIHAATAEVMGGLLRRVVQTRKSLVCYATGTRAEGGHIFQCMNHATMAVVVHGYTLTLRKFRYGGHSDGN